MSYKSNLREWLYDSSPNGKIIVRGRNLIFDRFSKKSLIRFSYLARKEKLSFRGYIIRCIMKGLKYVN